MSTESQDRIPEPQAENRARPRPLSRRRKWLFRLAAVGLSLFPLLVLECVLRWWGVGHDTRLVLHDEASAAPTAFHFNSHADAAYYGVEDLWGPDLRPFEVPKPEGVYRIVVVGGSTVAGFPYPFELAAPRQLELVLSRQMPERQFEVLNAGMTAIMSLSEIDVVRQALQCQPDLIVIHSGHNEFYGPGGSASNFGSVTPSLYPLAQVLKRQRSFQLLLSMAPRPSKKHLVEALPADIDIPLNSDTYRETEVRFRRNLQRMIGICAEAKVPVLLTTVPSNLRDIAPLSPPKNEIALRRLKEAGRSITYGEYEPALAALEEAERADPDDPLVVYRKAQCLEGLGREQEAAEAYALAADLDGCRFRAPRSFLTAIRDVAEQAPPEIRFCDVAEQLQSRSDLAAPGNDYFLEHVHFNFEGHWEVACILGRSIVEDVLEKDWRPERLPDDAARDELLGVTLLDHLAAESITLVGLGAWPFTLSPARREETLALKSRMEERFYTLEPIEREIFAGLPLDAMQQHLHLAMGDAWLAAGKLDRALAAYNRHLERRPWDGSGYTSAATALEKQGETAEAGVIRARAKKARDGG